MGSVHMETYAQGRGNHEFDYLKLTDESVLKNLILNRRKLDLYYDLDVDNARNIYSASECTIFYENILILYMDLDNLIKKTRLTKLQRWLVGELMYGYDFNDIIEDKGLDINNIYLSFEKAIYRLRYQAEENWKFNLMWDKVKTNINWKRCSKCEEFKPATKEYFSPDESKIDGLKYICRNCR